jgi:hypothetical protein
MLYFSRTSFDTGLESNSALAQECDFVFMLKFITQPKSDNSAALLLIVNTSATQGRVL